MRRFFLGSRAKGKDKHPSSAPGPAGSAGSAATGPGASPTGGILNESLGRSRHNDKPSATSANAAGDEVGRGPQQKQVAFGTVEEVSAPSAQAYDTQSLAPSHHGLLGNACLPSAATGARSASAGAGQHSKDTISHAQKLMQVSRHVSVDENRDATIRPAAMTAARGDIPHFAQTHDDEPEARAGTAMSHETASTTYSRQNSPGGLYSTGPVHPNLAILALYARDMNAQTGGNGIMQHLTWSDITDDDLVDNLGGRERIRQEVLFEMVCSEERYVQELATMKENYLDPLLQRVESSSVPPTASLSASAGSVGFQHIIKSSESIELKRKPLLDVPVNNERRTQRMITPVSANSMRSLHSALASDGNASVDHLPIAARFARRVSVDAGPANTGPPGHPKSRDVSGGTNVSGTTAVDSGEETDASSSNPHYPTVSSSRSRVMFAQANASRSQTLASSHVNSSATNVGSVTIPKAFKHHLKNLVPTPPNKLHKATVPAKMKDLPLILPEELRVLCEVIAEHVLTGHKLLSERLRARYEEQYPLVRTLADVFTDQEWMVKHYANYVLHLEGALQEIEDALQLMNPLIAVKKDRIKSRDELKEQKRLAKFIMELEERAAVHGSPGLSICLSQPFQRLLKYPLLFQSLLYHTDPSTRDYDATQKLVFEIDSIVRSIENEKVSEDERAKTRDCWARIEGINDKTLMTPRPDRMLVSETAMWAKPAPAIAAARRTLSDAGRDIVPAENADVDLSKSKRSHRRLSDLVGSDLLHRKKDPSVGSKRDVWLVAFTDVVLRCQRVAVTKLPAGASSNASHARKSVSLTHRERNLYKFLKIDTWVMTDQTSTRHVSMNEVARSRRSLNVTEEPLSDTDVDEGDFQAQEKAAKASGGESRMSFTYANDEPRPAFDVDPLIGLVQAPSTPRKTGKQPVKAPLSPTAQQVVRRQGAAAAKFSNRMRPSLGDSPQSLNGRRAVTPNARERTVSPMSGGPARDRGGFDRPTAASKARAAATNHLSPTASSTRRLEPPVMPEAKRARAFSSEASQKSPPVSPQTTPKTHRVRRSSFSAVHSDNGKGSQLRTKHSSERLGRHRQESDLGSGMILYNQFWKNDDHELAKLAA